MAGEFKVKYLCVSAASLVDKYIGQTEENLEAMFRTAQAQCPVLLFIDEIDAIGTKRQQLGESDDTGGAARSFNLKTDRLMGCIDDTRKRPGLILMAATNFYDGLDRALVREGRFDLHVRLDISLTKKIGLGSLRPSWPNGHRRGLMSERSRKKTPGWSAAKIGTVVDRAAFLAAEEQRKIEERDLARELLADTGGKDRAAFKEVEWADVVLSPDTEADLRNLVRLMDPTYEDG